MASVLKRKDTDMTEGSIPMLLISFTLPLMIGNIFQQLYNTVDSVVVGNYVSKQALAAVGCTGPIINTLFGLFGGLAAGAGVVISQFYGAHDKEKLHKAVQTTITMSLLMCVLLTVLGVWLTPIFLELMSTPEDVMADATEYLRIYFWGVSGVIMYYIGAGILRAVGDSTRPLYFLVFSAVTNTVLDIVFVKYCSMGIAGAAIATVIAQVLSAILVMLLLIRSKADYRVDCRDLRMTGSILSKICVIGIPSALQLAITAFSNVFVQSYINRFESSCMAGWTACNKVDSFALLPMMSLSVAITTFVGQNLGAGKYERAKAGAKSGIIIGLVVMAVVLTPLCAFAPQIAELFNRETEVVEFGARFIRLISPFYLMVAVNQVYSGALRGAGDTRSTMFIMLGTYVVFRQIYLFVVYKIGGGVDAIVLGYPIAWVLCSIFLLIYYYRGGWLKKIQSAGETL